MSNNIHFEKEIKRSAKGDQSQSLAFFQNGSGNISAFLLPREHFLDGLEEIRKQLGVDPLRAYAGIDPGLAATIMTDVNYLNIDLVDRCTHLPSKETLTEDLASLLLRTEPFFQFWLVDPVAKSHDNGYELEERAGEVKLGRGIRDGDYGYRIPENGGKTQKPQEGATPELSRRRTFVSRYHAQICIENGQIVIKDRDSTSGTFVNGKRHNERALTSGDIISLSEQYPILFYAPAEIEALENAIQFFNSVSKDHSPITYKFTPGFLLDNTPDKFDDVYDAIFNLITPQRYQNDQAAYQSDYHQFKQAIEVLRTEGIKLQSMYDAAKGRMKVKRSL